MLRRETRQFRAAKELLESRDFQPSHLALPATKGHAMFNANNFQDFQKFGQANVDASMKLFGEWQKNWQTVAAEMTNYSKRSFEEGTQTFEKLLGAKSLDQAMEIQTSYAKRAYEDYVQQMTKFGALFQDLTKEAYKPVERAFNQAR